MNHELSYIVILIHYLSTYYTQKGLRAQGKSWIYPVRYRLRLSHEVKMDPG